MCMWSLKDGYKKWTWNLFGRQLFRLHMHYESCNIVMNAIQTVPYVIDPVRNS